MAIAATDNEIEPVSVIGPPIPHVFDASGTAPYNLLFSDLVKSYTGEVSMTFLPPKRARRAFDAREGDCVFIGSDKTLTRHPRRSELIRSKSVTASAIYFFSMKLDGIASQPEQMRDKRLAIENGTRNTLISQVPAVASINTIITEDPFQAFELLQYERVDAVAAFIEDAVAYSASTAQPLFHFDKSAPLVNIEEIFVCWKSDRTEQFIKSVNRAIDQLRSSGRLQELLGDMYHEPDSLQDED